MAIFSPQPLKRWFFFRQSDPPLQEESKCTNAQFLQWILKDDVYFKKNYSILNLGEFFQSEKYRVFTQYAAATILRHWATMS